jgi:HlyD family secretion protein
LAISNNKSLSEVELCKQTVKFSKIDFENYKLGQYPQDLQVANNTIILAEEELKRAEDKLNWSKKLAEEGFLTRSELEGDRLEVKRKRLNLELARSKLQLLEAFTYKRQVEKLESELYQAEQALVRAEKMHLSIVFARRLACEPKNLSGSVRVKNA